MRMRIILNLLWRQPGRQIFVTEKRCFSFLYLLLHAGRLPVDSACMAQNTGQPKLSFVLGCKGADYLPSIPLCRVGPAFALLAL
jgi:hypothetical protein